MSEKTAVVEVVDRETGEVVHSVKTTPSRLEKVAGGISINLDHERFEIRERQGG